MLGREYFFLRSKENKLNAEGKHTAGFSVAAGFLMPSSWGFWSLEGEWGWIEAVRTAGEK